MAVTGEHRGPFYEVKVGNGGDSAWHCGIDDVGDFGGVELLDAVACAVALGMVLAVQLTWCGAGRRRWWGHCLEGCGRYGGEIWCRWC